MNLRRQTEPWTPPTYLQPPHPHCQLALSRHKSWCRQPQSSILCRFCCVPQIWRIYLGRMESSSLSLHLSRQKCTSLSSMTLPPSSSHRQRQTNFSKEQKSTSRGSTLSYAPSPPSTVSSSAIRLPTFHSISWFTFQQTLLRRSS